MSYILCLHFYKKTWKKTMITSNFVHKNTTTFSLEFFPPKTTQAQEKLDQTLESLLPFHPTHINVTYGADGSTKTNTKELATQIQNKHNVPVVAHLTCYNATKQQIHDILQYYQNNNIHNIFALRGDPPQDKIIPTQTDFSHAIHLVQYIKQHFPNMIIGVAGFPHGHPESSNQQQEIEYLKQKIDAGADYICTQLFYDNTAFYQYIEQCQKIKVSIIPGLMPIHTKQLLDKIQQLAPNTKIPTILQQQLQKATTDEQIQDIFIHWTIQQIQDLQKNNIHHFHLFTLNQTSTIMPILQTLHANK